MPRNSVKGFTPLENTVIKEQNSLTGFTFIELVIAVAISTMIAAALFFSLRSAFESWQVAEDELVLQQISSRIMEELTEGQPDTYGLRDALEVTDGTGTQITVVMPWTDDTHIAYSGVSTYTLNRHLKPGTSAPITEVLLPDAKEYKVIPAVLADKGRSEDYPDVQLAMNLPSGSKLRFTYHPDVKRGGDTVTTFRFDPSEKAIFIEDSEGIREISKNLFSVKIADFGMKYFDNTNTEVGSNGSVSTSEIAGITGIEITITAESKNNTLRQTTTFVSMRNAARRSGNLTLNEGMRISIPDSADIKALLLTNLRGINNNDVLILDARPQSGKDWLLTIKFSKLTSMSAPLIEFYSIEYPEGNKVYSDRPRTPADIGLNLLNLGPNGRYDYGIQGMEDIVNLQGKVTLEVKKMDISGAGLFVKP